MLSNPIYLDFHNLNLIFAKTDIQASPIWRLEEDGIAGIAELLNESLESCITSCCEYYVFWRNGNGGPEI